jgi:AcrR family transcriptional regulator
MTAKSSRAARATAKPPATRDSYHHGDLRRALVEASVALVGERGAHELTLREVARRVGVNHRAAYRHFASKEDLLAAVAEQGWWSLVERLRRELEGVDDARPEARLVAVGQAYVEFALEHAGYYQVMFGPRLNEQGRYPAIEVPIQAAVALLELELRRRLAGRHAPASSTQVRDAGLALWAAMHGIATLVQQRRIRVKRALVRPYVAELLGPTIRGLGA